MFFCSLEGQAANRGGHARKVLAVAVSGGMGCLGIGLQEGVMEENVRLALLYDTYGELLSEHQRQIFEAARFRDCSLSEIAEEFDISRQAAHDVYRRTVAKLATYEDALSLVDKYVRLRKRTEQIISIAGELEADGGGRQAQRIGALANEILEEL